MTKVGKAPKSDNKVMGKQQKMYERVTKYCWKIDEKVTKKS